MRGLGGFVLLAGIGVGLFVYFPAPVDRNTTLEQATRAVESRVAESRVAEILAPLRPVSTASPPASRLAGFSPATPLNSGHRKTRVAAAALTNTAPPALAPTAQIEAIPNWKTNVVPAAQIVGGPSGSLEPTDPESRYKLVVDIQQQLKRVGCYWGRANGSWNANTRDAMRDFTTRSNAALPVDKPDYLLLSLLKSHNGRSCGGPETTTVAAQPHGNAKQAVAAAAPTPEVLPWKANASSQQQAIRLYTPVPNSVVSSEPLPGRMAIGGPHDFPAPAQAPLIPGTPSQGGVATAALEPGAAPRTPSAPAASAPRPRQTAKKSSRRVAPGTPRYNLMLSLGGVY